MGSAGQPERLSSGEPLDLTPVLKARYQGAPGWSAVTLLLASPFAHQSASQPDKKGFLGSVAV
ncbi:hypothetical protein GCM10010326_71950 [Streptomyces xanthochromogenes]|uniref:Uncharacterized protein n=1 Tax=Streptomyces xanthochromogenes TaxID=67384 RepID=A0ABQ3AV27_9ACTN|nr:hypothetical protein GCM10010326_71950 [Streptomyces xanthochromogenes]